MFERTRLADHVSSFSAPTSHSRRTSSPIRPNLIFGTHTCKVGDAVSTLEAEGNANACRALAIQAKAENYQIGCQDAERKDAVILTAPIKLHEKICSRNKFNSGGEH